MLKMLVKQDTLNKIKDYFDLNIYETKIWLALLSKGIASAGEVAQLSGVPRSRAYDVLESLEKRGFAIAKIGKPVKYLGVKPKVVIEKMKNNAQKEAEEKISILSRVKETEEFNELETLYTTGINPIKREDISASIKGRSNISNYLREVLENAQKEVIICTTAEELISKLKIFQQTFDRLQKSKIKVQIALSGEENLINKISKHLNIKIKKVDLNAKFFIVDKREILFYLMPAGSDEELAIWLNSDFFSEAFANLFEKAVK